MPTLTVTKTYAATQVLREADLDGIKNSLETFFNTTGIDDTNIQNAGITRATKLKTGTNHAVVINDGSGQMSEIAPGTAGQRLTTQGAGSAPTWETVSVGVTSMYEAILGSSAQVTAGTATHTDFASALAAISAGDSILVLNEYATTENWTVTKQINIQGVGRGSFIDGTVTFDSSSDNSSIDKVRLAGKLTFQANCDNCYAGAIWSDQTTAANAVDDSGTDNFIQAIFLS